MPELPEIDADRGAAEPGTAKPALSRRALPLYRQILDGIVVTLVFVMVLTLLGALAGLVLDFTSAARAFWVVVANHKLAHGVVYATDRELVIDVLSVFLLIELFRTFTDYLEIHRVRLGVLAEVGIAFVLREVFIGLYDRNIDSQQILALAAMLLVLVSTRVAATQFPPKGDASE
jgi:uncharacterized membrane protein (DUF373 family)